MSNPYPITPEEEAYYNKDETDGLDDLWSNPWEARQCPDCKVWTYNDDHVCVEYKGLPCKTCGKPTTCYTVGAPGYGQGRVCADGHDEPTTPQGILTIGDVI